MANIRTLFRKTPQSRQKEYFEARIGNFPNDFDWTLGGRDLAEALEVAISNTTEKLENLVRADLDNILGLADRDGWRAVEETCRGGGVDLDSCEGQHDAIMMLALQHRTLFERALMTSSFKRRNGGRDWSAFELKGGQSAIDISDEIGRERFLAEALQILGVPPGRKREADWYDSIRRDPVTGEERRVTQATIYVEERPESSLAFGEGDSVEWSVVPRVGEVAFSYDAREKIFEVCAAGGKLVREKYAHAFAECFVGETSQTVETPMREIDFGPLMQSPNFPHDPADRIDSFEVSQLAFYSTSGGFTTFERRGDGESIHDFIARRFGEQSPTTATGWKMTSATLRIIRSPVDGVGRKKTLTVDLKAPNRTTLRNKTEEDRMFVTDLLDRWGLFAAQRDNGALVEPD